MSVHQTEAFTLRTYPFAELHKVAVFLTRDSGKLRGVAHGARHGRSRFGCSLEPLTQVRLTFQTRPNQELTIIQNCEIIRALPAYQLSWEVNLHVSYFCELLSECVTEGTESVNVFRLTSAVSQVIQEAPIRILARYFELWLLRLEGILPAMEQNLPLDLANKARSFMKCHPSSLTEATLDTEETTRLEKFSVQLIEQHLEKPLKTVKMLRQLMDAES